MVIADDIPWGPCRIALPSVQPMYAAARQWRDVALVGDHSLFDGRRIDGKAAVEELVRYYVDNPDLGSGSFVSKLRIQLADVDEATVQVAAELLYVHALIASTTMWSASSKLKLINEIVGFRESGVAPPPPDLATALTGGATNTGQAYGQYRWKMFVYLIRVFEAVKSLGVEQREVAVSSLAAFREATSSIDTQTVWTQQYALEHLLFPAVAPPVVSRNDRDTIANVFGGEGNGILDVYPKLEENVHYGRHAYVDAYEPPYRRVWNPVESEEVYAGWARRVAHDVNLDRQERDYKQERIPLLRAALDAATRADEPLTTLREALKGFNVIDYRVQGTFLAWVESDPAAANSALVELQREPGPESIDRFLDRVPVDSIPGMGARLSIASTLLMGCGAEEFPPWRETAAKATQRLSGGYSAESAATAGEIYLLFLQRLDAIRTAVNADQDPPILRDRLDTQGLAWTVAAPDIEPDGWTASDLDAYNAWRLGKRTPSNPHPLPPAPETSAAPNPTPAPPDPEIPPSLEGLAEQLNFDDEGIKWLEETLTLLDHKRQIILQGPPGTGKTYLAMAMAKFVTGSPERVTIVQFHPGTSYEDFVQGLRPDPKNPASFIVVDGPLIEIARAADQHPDNTYVLLIDEVNRGNIPAIFGELYFLLEYRTTTVTLMYGTKRSLPPNLFIIGTMNTADRSITSLDSALRRRFYIRDLRPDQPPVDGSLRRYLQRHRPHLGWLADLLDLANRRINDPDQSIGPSQFMGDSVDETWARRAWSYTVIPTLRELFYNQPERVANLDFDVLQTAVNGTDNDLAAD